MLHSAETDFVMFSLIFSPLIFIPTVIINLSFSQSNVDVKTKISLNHQRRISVFGRAKNQKDKRQICPDDFSTANMYLFWNEIMLCRRCEMFKTSVESPFELATKKNIREYLRTSRSTELNFHKTSADWQDVCYGRGCEIYVCLTSKSALVVYVLKLANWFANNNIYNGNYFQLVVIWFWIFVISFLVQKFVVLSISVLAMHLNVGNFLARQNWLNL